jgi:hypothetical protein
MQLSLSFRALPLHVFDKPNLGPGRLWGRISHFLGSRPVSDVGQIFDRSAVLSLRVLEIVELRAQVQQLRQKVLAAEERKLNWERAAARSTAGGLRGDEIGGKPSTEKPNAGSKPPVEKRTPNGGRTGIGCPPPPIA